MKKIKFFVLTLLVALMTTTTFAATKIDSTTAVAANDSTLATEGKEYLKSITMNGGKAITTGYEVMLQQQKMIAWMYTFVGFIALIATILFFIFYVKISKDSKNLSIPIIICAVVGIWCWTLFAQHFTQIFQGFLNPDYAAIKDIVNLFKANSR